MIILVLAHLIIKEHLMLTHYLKQRFWLNIWLLISFTPEDTTNIPALECNPFPEIPPISTTSQLKAL